MTFLAVRRWFGWSAGRLLVLDIGGGSLEIGGRHRRGAGGRAVAAAGRRPADPGAAARRPAARRADVDALTAEYVDEQLDPVVDEAGRGGLGPAGGHLEDVPDAGPAGRRGAVRRRAAGAARSLTRTGLHQVLGFIRHIPPAALAEMDGVSAGRAHQLLAGAVVAEATMRRLGLEALDICPWALREGVILRRLDQLEPM